MEVGFRQEVLVPFPGRLWWRISAEADLRGSGHEVLVDAAIIADLSTNTSYLNWLWSCSITSLGGKTMRGVRGVDTTGKRGRCVSGPWVWGGEMDKRTPINFVV